MKRILTILVLPFVVGALATSASASGAFYGWTITNLNGESEAAWVPGLLTLKLNFACSTPENLAGPGGMSAAEFDVVSTNPANVLLAITAKDGFLNAGSGNKLLLAVGGCPTAQSDGQGAWANACDILVLSNAPGQYILTPSNITGVKGTVDCNPVPALWPIQWMGFADDGIPPEMKDWDKCAGKAPVSVEQSSWGKIKSSYR